MALWKDDKSDDFYDDGQTTKPGEETFTRELAEAHFGHKNFSYVGTPNWEPPKETAPPQDAPAP